MILKAVNFNANSSGALMMAFLHGDVGFYFQCANDKKGIDDLYYVQGVRFKIKPGGSIMFKWNVKKICSLLLGLSQVTVEFGGIGTTDGVNIGYLPHATDLPERTYSAWVWRDSLDTPNTAAMIFGHLTDLAGVGIYVGTNNTKLNVQIKCTGGQGVWETATTLLPADSAWHHIVVTINANTVTPIAYVDGVARTLTEVTVHAGTVQPESGVPLIIGNELTATIPQNLPFNGRIKDARVYNRILSAAEVTTLYNGGTPDETLVTDGMVFQAFCVRTKDLASFVDATLTASMKLLDNIQRAVGTPHGAPVGRTP
jgi:hypothetical protein